MVIQEQEEVRGGANETGGRSETALRERRLTSRGFLKMVAGAVAGVAVVQTLGTRIARATYYPGPPGSVDRDLTVNGDLIVDGNVGIGTSSPAGRLDIAGSVANGATIVLDGLGCAKRCYYSDGTPLIIPAGSWGILANHTWGELQSYTWAQLATIQ